MLARRVTCLRRANTPRVRSRCVPGFSKRFLHSSAPLRKSTILDPENTSFDNPHFISAGVIKVLGECMEGAVLIPPNLRRWKLPCLAISLGGITDVGNTASNRVSYRHYTENSTSSNSLYRLGTLSSLFTAVCVMQLAEKEYFSLEEPVQEYIKSFPLIEQIGSNQQNPITFRQLLSHTAGLNTYSTGFKSWKGERSQTYKSEPPSVKDYLGSVKVPFRPGQECIFSHVGYAILGQIIEDVTNVSLAEYAQENLFKPLGMKSTTFNVTKDITLQLIPAARLTRYSGFLPVKRDAYYALRASTSAVSTLEDMERFLFMLLNYGLYETKSGATQYILQPKTVKQMFTQQFRSHSALPGMGLGFTIDENFGDLEEGVTAKVASFIGGVNGFTSCLSLVPERGLGFVALANRYDTHAMSELYHLLTSQLVSSTIEPPAEKPGSVEYDEEYLKSWVGFYALESQSLAVRWNEWFTNGTTLQVRYLPEIKRLAFASAARKGHLNKLRPLQPSSERDVFLYDTDRIINNRVVLDSIFGTKYLKLGMLSYKKL